MLPHFIGIGAQKSATTWLHYILKAHPQVWMPPMKELHFFNRPNNDSHFKTLLFHKKNINSKNRFRYSDKKINYWNYKYFFYKRDIDYYQSLFLPEQGQICGEITPSYATIDESRIQEIARTFPKIKIIYLMRNPIERDWSQLCMTLENHFKKDITQLSKDEVMSYHKAKYLKQSAYAENADRWENHFKREQIFYGFYDELKETPNAFLKKLFNFLNIDDEINTIQSNLNSFSKPVSPLILKEITIKEIQNIEAINLKFNNEYTNRWLSEAKKLLKA